MELVRRDRYSDCCALAGKLLRAAEEREEAARVLRLAAAKYMAGAYMALSDVRREVDGETVTLLELVGRQHRGLVRPSPQ